MRNPKRWIAALLTAVMLFSALPGAAFASEADEDGVQQEEQVTRQQLRQKRRNRISRLRLRMKMTSPAS